MVRGIKKTSHTPVNWYMGGRLALVGLDHSEAGLAVERVEVFCLDDFKSLVYELAK